ncbi:hypothetical protein A9Q86_03230 [Flavobacteriales bacterium 33_180_T64]|nr:hypothetical protein A9Q86_03230 [Flavobacteriales bacterium 33_180_T64]
MKRKIFREDIIKAGRDLMFVNGYYATGIKEITSSVNIPKGSFYNHFSNKEEFGLEVLKDYSLSGLEYLKNVLITSGGSPLKRLDVFYSGIIEYQNNIAKCKLGCIMGNFSLELGDVNEAFREVLDEEFNEYEAIFTECLKEAQEKEEIRKDLDVDLLGAFLLNSWHGALLRMKSTGTTKPLEDFKTFVFQQLSN